MNKSFKIGEKFPFLLSKILLPFIITYGIFIRFSEYLANRSIWLDEAALALNVIDKSSLQLITQPLDYNQAAPIGFLLLTKFLITIFGNNEYSLRVIPFLSSIVSFFIFYQLLMKCTPKDSTLIALTLFAISVELLRYATEFKQYSSDVLIVLFLELFGISLLQRRLTLKRGVYFGIIGTVAIWFSYPSIFVLGGIGLTLFFFYLSNKHWEEIKNLCISFILWGVSFISIYFLILKEIGANSSLEKYWTNSFMPLPPYSINDQFWFVKKLIEVFYYPGMLQQALFGVVAFILGTYAIFKKEKQIFFMLLTPLILTLIASSVHQYPFEGRLILFYVPFLYLFVAEGLFFLINKSSYLPKILGIVFLVTFLWSPLMTACGQLSHRMVYSEEIKPILNYVKTHMQEEDTIYVYYGADLAFIYYAEFYGFNKDSYIKGIGSRDKWENYQTDLSQLKGRQRVWIIFTHVYFSGQRSEESYMVNYLESLGTRVDAIRAIGASAYLYTFSNS